jgi:hypothetical protein
MAVFNEGSRSQVADLFEFAVDLEDQVLGMTNALEQVQDTLSQLTALYPESLSYAGLDDRGRLTMTQIEAFNRALFLHINGGDGTPAWLIQAAIGIADNLIYLIPLLLVGLWLWRSCAPERGN